jgi:hypothetical protein
MKKQEIVELIEPLRDVAMYYGDKLWKLKSYTVDEEQGRVYLHTHQGRQYDRPFDGIKEFLEQLTPIKTNNALNSQPPKNTIQQMNQRLPEIPIVDVDTKAPETFADLKKILLANIDGLRKGTLPVDRAKEISNHAQTLVNITKLEMEYAKSSEGKKQ